MKTKSYSALILFLYLPFSGFSINEWSIDRIAPQLKLNAKEVVRQKTVKYTVLDESNSIKNYKKVYTILEKNSSERTITLDYSDLKKIQNVDVKVYDKDGKLLKSYKKKDFLNIADSDYSTFFSNYRTMYLEIKELEFPMTIDLEYEMEEKFNFFYPNFYIQESFEQSIEKQTFTVAIPRSQSINYKNVNTNIQEQKYEDIKYRYFEWKTENNPALKYQPYQDINTIIPVVLISPSTFVVEGTQGSMNKWQDYSKFIFDLNKNTRSPSPEIQKLAKTIIGSTSDKREKINLIYDYVKSKMRYVNVMLGIGGFKSHDINYVNKNSFGDCKALTNFTQALLNEVGIESCWALIYRDESSKSLIPDDFVSPKFNHAILYIESEDIWLECTSKSLPLGYIGKDNMDRSSLLIKESGGKLVNTPKSQDFASGYTSLANVKIDVNVGAVVDLNIDVTGTSHDYIRYYSDNLNQSQKEKFIQNYIDANPQNFKSISLDFDTKEPKAHIATHFDIHKIGSYSGNRLFFNANIIDRISLQPKADSVTLDSFTLDYDYSDNIKIFYEIPENFKLENLPFKTEKVISDFLNYEATIEQNENQVVYKRTCTYKPGTFSKDAYQKYIRVCKEVNKLETGKIILIKKS